MGRQIIALIIFGLFLYVAWPLLLPVVMGAVLAVLVYPWLEALEKKKVRTSLASAILTFGVTLVFLLPVSILVFSGAKAGLRQVKRWKGGPAGDGGQSFAENLLDSPAVQRVLDFLTDWFPIEAGDIVNAAQDLAAATGLKLADALGAFFTQLPGMVMGLAVTGVSIYFFLADGRRALDYIRGNTLLGEEQTERLIRAFGGMCRSVILATVLSGLGQAFVYGIALFATSTPNAALLTLFVFLGSFIPLIGAAPITFGVPVYMLLTGHKTAAIVLLITALLVGLVDNLIRPAVLKGGGNLHPLLAFISAFGGLQAFGFVGVFLGPIIAGLLVVTFENLTHSERMG